MTSLFADIAHRIDNAHEDFTETLIRLGEFDREDAIKVKNLYLAKKLAKIDIGIGRINVKHGAYLDQDVLTRALAMANEA